MNNYGPEEQKLLSFDAEDLTYVRRGVLWVKGEPHYIIELFLEKNVMYVMVYDVEPGTIHNPQKAMFPAQERKFYFSQRTELGKLANSMFKPPKTRNRKDKPALFVAPVIPGGVATLTRKEEAGFFEREPDKLMQGEGGKLVFRRGENTRVFIGLSSIDWEDKIRVPTESLVKNLTRRAYYGDSFYDLEGDNASDNNPLSTYYGKHLSGEDEHV
jgi:hypothetical protein